MTLMEDGLEAITAEESTSKITDDIYDKVKAQWTEFDTRYRAKRGAQFNSEGMQGIMALIRKYAPGLATKFGYPGIAAAFVGMSADDGAFSGITSLFGKIFGFFGG